MANDGLGKGNNAIYIDTSEVNDLLDRMKKNLTPIQYKYAMKAAFKRVGTRVGTIAGKYSAKEYMVKSSDVRKATGKPQINEMGGVNCVVPITGARNSIGKGKAFFKATGSAPGWNIPKGGYKVTASIVRGSPKEITGTKSKYGTKPFNNSRAKKLNNLVFARVSKSRLPIAKIVGIAVPQMPANLACEDTQDEIMTVLKDRLQHEMEFRMQKMAGKL